jgi:hypothetical protein
MKTYTHPNVPDNPIQDEDSLPEYTGQDLSDPDADYDNFREYHGSLVEDCASLVEQCEAFIALRNTPAMPNIFELAKLEKEAEQKRRLDSAMKQVLKDADNLNWRRVWAKQTT